MTLADLDHRSSISALLGPTNTGKTHRAVRRMLGHRSGMLGLPLRLLAREIYDRVTAEIGETSVALVTGEERRVPVRPRYWICTVEAMPVQRPVDFLAVDEIQLATHRERGNVFTERLLHARGFRETWFMGAESMAPVLSGLVPTADIRAHPRLSRLSWAGVCGIGSLPPRSAVVAFSAARVYALAEQIRARRGGAAVVMGALSPRARNAQVAMYQAGEVQHIVATDAIGMGLNMDIDHVALGAVQKFDGVQRRPLGADEVAQIAGRAGRHRRDGTFGTLASGEELAPELVRAVERHRFVPVTTLEWRNPELDMESIDGLIDSLRAAPPRRCLRRTRVRADQGALEVLARSPEVRRLARRPMHVRLLWDVCQIPDYRKNPEEHAALLKKIHAQLRGPRGRLDPDWISTHLDRLERSGGDIQSLMAHISDVRTWTYVAHRADWTDDPRHWQGRARAVEDRLSDALHERLTQRFVDRRTMVLSARLAGGTGLEADMGEDGMITVAEQALGRLEGFSFTAAPARGRRQARLVQRAARIALDGELSRRVAAIVAAEHDAFQVDDQLRLCWGGHPLATLRPGKDRLTPAVRLHRLEMLAAGARRQVERRLRAWCRDLAVLLFAPLRAVAPPSPVMRGLLYQIEQALGVLPRDAASGLDELSGRERGLLRHLDVRLGRRWIYAKCLQSDGAIRARAQLWAVHARRERLPALPAATCVCEPAAGRPAELLLALGFPILGGLAVRVDQAESIAARLRGRARRGPFKLPATLHEQLECPEDALGGVVRGLGFRPVAGGRWLRARR